MPGRPAAASRHAVHGPAETLVLAEHGIQDADLLRPLRVAEQELLLVLVLRLGGEAGAERSNRQGGAGDTAK